MVHYNLVQQILRKEPEKNKTAKSEACKEHIVLKTCYGCLKTNISFQLKV